MVMSPGDSMGYDPKETDSLYKHIPFYIKLNPGTKKAVGFFGVISHGVSGAHYHKFLSLIKFAAFFAETKKAVLSIDLTCMDPAVV